MIPVQWWGGWDGPFAADCLRLGSIHLTAPSLSFSVCSWGYNNEAFCRRSNKIQCTGTSSEPAAKRWAHLSWVTDSRGSQPLLGRCKPLPPPPFGLAEPVSHCCQLEPIIYSLSPAPPIYLSPLHLNYSCSLPCWPFPPASAVPSSFWHSTAPPTPHTHTWKPTLSHLP